MKMNNVARSEVSAYNMLKERWWIANLLSKVFVHHKRRRWRHGNPQNSIYRRSEKKPVLNVKRLLKRCMFLFLMRWKWKKNSNKQKKIRHIRNWFYANRDFQGPTHHTAHDVFAQSKLKCEFTRHHRRNPYRVRWVLIITLVLFLCCWNNWMGNLPQ